MKRNKLFRDKNEPGRIMDVWSKVDPESNLDLNEKEKREKRRKVTFSLIFNSGHELEREKRETPHSLYDLRRSGG